MVHVAALERSHQRAMEWVQDVMAELATADGDAAYSAIHGVLRALRDRLTAEESRQFAAQLPAVLRGAFYEGWTGRVRRPARSQEEFLARVADLYTPKLGIGPEEATRAVFKVIATHVSAGEMRDVVATMPAGIRALWPHQHSDAQAA